MKSFKYILGIFFALLLVFSAAQSALAGNSVTPQFLCEDAGGTWNGSDEYTGTCTYGPDPERETCPDHYVVITFVEGELIDGECVESISTPGTPADTDSHHSGNSTTASVTTCTLASGDWRCAYFAEGVCAVNCYIDPHLPAGAQAALPGGVITTLYVNISPDPGGSYSVCFENPDNESLTIYQYLGGTWVTLATSTNNPICASASGDGSFYLGS